MRRGLTDTYFAAVVGIIAIVISAYAIRAVLRLDVEEEAHRAEYVLATATPRHRFAWSHLVFRLGSPGRDAGRQRGDGRGDLWGHRRRCRPTSPECSRPRWRSSRRFGC